MSSPTSDSSSSRSLDGDADRDQSTRERRRERNRLAAQKHRLRRNERMSQLEQQVLELQQEKSQLVAQLDNVDAPSHAAASVAGAPVPASVHSIDLELRRDLGLGSDLDPPLRGTKRPRTSASSLAGRDDHHADPQFYQDTIRRLEQRILELERWSEDLNGDLADALDSEARLKHELSHALHSADSHARRLADTIHQLETERARAARELVDMTAARDAEAASARTLRDANVGLRESVEAAEVTLDLQRVENERLRDRLEESSARASRATARLEDELRETRVALEDTQIENRRFRKMLREQEAFEDASLTRRVAHERHDREFVYTRSPSLQTSRSPSRH